MAGALCLARPWAPGRSGSRSLALQGPARQRPWVRCGRGPGGSLGAEAPRGRHLSERNSRALPRLPPGSALSSIASGASHVCVRQPASQAPPGLPLRLSLGASPGTHKQSGVLCSASSVPASRQRQSGAVMCAGHHSSSLGTDEAVRVPVEAGAVPHPSCSPREEGESP